MLRSIPFLVCLAAATPAFADSHAANATTALLEIECKDASPEHARFALALPPDHDCSSMNVWYDRRELSLSVCREGGDEDAPGVQLVLERIDHSAPEVAAVKLKASVRLRRGTSTPIGSFQRAASGANEIVASLR